MSKFTQLHVDVNLLSPRSTRVRLQTHSCTYLRRKVWSNPLLCDPWKKFSRLEAWLYLTNVLAAGVDDQAAGLKRGELSARSNGKGVLEPCKAVLFLNVRTDHVSSATSDAGF